MVKVKIEIDDNGVKTDLDGFAGEECFRFMDKVEAAVENEHGLAVKDKVATKKSRGAQATQANRLNQGGS